MTAGFLRFARLAAIALSTALAACATQLPQLAPAGHVISTVRVVPDGVLAGVAVDAGIGPDLSGVLPLPQAAFALDARLALIANATTSLDLQYYVLADDATGRAVLRALRDAALRGVRVRLLLDDFHTTGMDRLLRGFTATPNVELRLFNPFVGARDSALARLLALAGDFRRLNRRMHNKLFIADGTLAVVGGRNLADEYFLRSTAANFIDFDLLLAGAVMQRLNALFDQYWNSDQAWPMDAVLRRSGETGRVDNVDVLRAGFEQATLPPPNAPSSASSAVAVPPSPLASDVYGFPPLSVALQRREYHFVAAPAAAHADLPQKADADNLAALQGDTLSHRFFERLHEAQTEVLLFSPYFVPGEEGLRRMRVARQRGVAVRVVTNSLAASDEPLVNVGYDRYRVEMLKMGVELYEISSARLKRDRRLRESLGSSSGRLHAKMAFVDRSTVLVGSMNLDPRSSYINTEIGVAVRSPELAKMILDAYRIDTLVGLYRVSLRPDGGLHWSAFDSQTGAAASSGAASGSDSGMRRADADKNNDGQPDEVDEEPDSTWWQRLQVWLLSRLVPEDLL